MLWQCGDRKLGNMKWKCSRHESHEQRSDPRVVIDNKKLSCGCCQCGNPALPGVRTALGNPGASWCQVLDADYKRRAKQELKVNF
jgi:hypothetical protein